MPVLSKTMTKQELLKLPISEQLKAPTYFGMGRFYAAEYGQIISTLEKKKFTKKAIAAWLKEKGVEITYYQVCAALKRWKKDKEKSKESNEP